MVFFLQADLPGLVEGLKALPSDGEGIISLYQLPNVVTQGGLVSLSFMFEIRSVFVVSCLECACGYSRVKDRNICYRYLLVLQFMFYGNSVILCRYLEYLKMVCTFRSLLRPPPPHSSLVGKISQVQPNVVYGMLPKTNTKQNWPQSGSQTSLAKI